MQHETNRSMSFAGDAVHTVTRNLGDLSTRPFIPQPIAQRTAAWIARNWRDYRFRDVPRLATRRLVGMIPGVITFESQLQARVYRPDWKDLAPWQIIRLRAMLEDGFDVRALPTLFGGQFTDFGVVSTRVVTTAGVNFLVDAFQGLVEPELMNFHGYGTGTTAENQTDTALVTELTTEYVTNNTRPTGTQGEGASANIYRTTATLSPDSGGTLAITEHGIFSQAATGGGTLWDRSVFSAINVVASADSLQTQYDLTCSANG